LAATVAAIAATERRVLPEVSGWVHVQTSRDFDHSMFVARVKGRAMEPAIPDGCWGLFRLLPAVTASGVALHGRRVVVDLRNETDPDTGGTYTLRRWGCVKSASEGRAVVLALMPDNPDYRPIAVRPEDVKVAAEFLEVVG
jgi:hypothetical protein